MTNELIAPAMEIAGTNALVTVVCDGGPWWQDAIIVTWMLLITVAPILSLILCIRAWVRQRHGLTSPSAGRVILGVTLLAFSLGVIHVLRGLSMGLFLAATADLGKAQQAMLRLNISHACSMLIVVVSVCFVCLLCALCLPKQDSRR